MLIAKQKRAVRKSRGDDMLIQFWVGTYCRIANEDVIFFKSLLLRYCTPVVAFPMSLPLIALNNIKTQIAFIFAQSVNGGAIHRNNNVLAPTFMSGNKSTLFKPFRAF